MKNKLTVTLLLLATMMTTGLFCSCKEKNDKEAYVGYLFAYFNGNAPWQEQICFALSADGYNYVGASICKDTGQHQAVASLRSGLALPA